MLEIIFEKNIDSNWLNLIGIIVCALVYIQKFVQDKKMFLGISRRNRVYLHENKVKQILNELNSIQAYRVKSILYNFISLLVSFVMLTIYYELANEWTEFPIFESEIFLPICLILISVVINLAYSLLDSKYCYDVKLKYSDKAFILLMSLLFISITKWSINRDFSILIIGLMLGKFIWIDFDIFDFKKSVFSFVSRTTRQTFEVTISYVLTLTIANFLKPWFSLVVIFAFMVLLSTICSSYFDRKDELNIGMK